MKDENQKEMQDRLLVEGILFKGFGHIPKFIMLDTDLTLISKSIYSYFCSYAGSGNSAFPSRDKIRRDLNVGKEKYYNHYNILIDEGYLKAEQSRYINDKGRSVNGNNIYTLIANPKKYIENHKNTDKHKNKNYSRIRNSGMKSQGYGTIPKSIMLDDRLSVEAKGIYSYFCSYAGSGNSAFPKVPNILYHLQISETTYYKYYRELVNLNYITVVQRVNENGQMDCCDYYLNEAPDMELVENEPSIKKPDTQDKPSIKKPDTQKPDTKKPYTQKPDTFITNSSFNTNSINYNQSINQQEKPLKDLKEIDRLTKNQLIKIVKEELKEQKQIPYIYTQDNRKMEVAIHILTNYDHTLKWHKDNKDFADEIHLTIFKLFNEAIIEMLTTEKMRLKGSYVTYAKVYDRLHENISIEKSKMLDEIIFSIGDILDNAINDYRNAAKEIEIQSPLAYMKSVIWNSLQVGNVTVVTEVDRIFGSSQRNW